MRKNVVDSVAMTITFLLLSISVCIAGVEKVSPHSDAGDCEICHVASADKLRSWFVVGSTKRKLKYDLNQVCLNCHTVDPSHGGGFLGVGKGHATGKTTAINIHNLPLANDGTITCATTCHNVHVASDDRQLQLKRLRLPVNSLCMSCHKM